MRALAQLPDWFTFREFKGGDRRSFNTATFWEQQVNLIGRETWNY